MGNDEIVWPYEKEITEHPLANNFLSTLDTLAERDSPRHHFFVKDTKAISLDDYEIYKAKKEGTERKKTVDAVIGICNEKQGKPKNPRLLLIELRLNYTNPDNLSYSEIHEKEIHSRNLLSKFIDKRRVDETYVLIFNETVFQQLRRNFYSRKNGNKKYKKWEIYTPEKFSNRVNLGKDLPYTPQEKSIGIIEKINDISSKKDMEGLEKIWEYTIDYMNMLYSKSKIAEYEWFINNLYSIISNFDENALTDDQKIILEIIREDIIKRTN